MFIYVHEGRLIRKVVRVFSFVMKEQTGGNLNCGDCGSGGGGGERTY